MAVAGRMPKGRSHNVGGHEHDGVGTETGAAAGTQHVTPCFRTIVFGLKSPAQLQIDDRPLVTSTEAAKPLSPAPVGRDH